MANGTKDREVDALAKVSEALEGLEQDAVSRILHWASTRYGVQLAKAPGAGGKDKAREERDAPLTYADVGDLFAAAAPTTDAHKALVVAYWFQQLQSQADFGSQDLNTQLKHLGHGVGNITDALQTLIDKRPALVIQIRKKGTTKQGRKRYKMTSEGARAVEGMLQREEEQ